MYVSFGKYVSLFSVRYLRKSGTKCWIVGVFSSRRCCQIAFQSCLYQLHPYQQCEVFSCSTFLPKLVIICFENLSHSGGLVVLYCDFILHFLMYYSNWSPFPVFIGHFDIHFSQFIYLWSACSGETVPVSVN